MSADDESFEVWWEKEWEHNPTEITDYDIAKQAYQAGVLAGKESILQKMPSEDDAEEERWMVIKRQMAGEKYETNFILCYRWMRDKLIND